GCTTALPKQPDKERMAALVCTVNHHVGDKVEIKVRLRNATKTLAVPLETAKIRYGTFPAYAGMLPLSPSFKHDLNSGGDVDIRYRAFFWFTGTTTITLPVYSAHTRYTETSGKNPSWFFDNEWYRLTHYVAAQPLLPKASGTCVPGDPDPDKTCLTV